MSHYERICEICNTLILEEHTVVPYGSTTATITDYYCQNEYCPGEQEYCDFCLNPLEFEDREFLPCPCVKAAEQELDTEAA